MTRKTDDWSDILAPVALFKGLDALALDQVGTCARSERVAKGARIFAQGNAAERGWVLIAGGIRIVQTGRDGGQAAIRFIAGGELFGTVALFAHRHYPADAEAITDSRILSWSEADLLDLIQRHGRIALNLIRIVASRLDEAQERIREISTLAVDQRIAHALLRLVHQTGKGDGNSTTLGLPLRRKDVAELAGTTLHSASRTLTRWRTEGVLDGRGRTLIIRDLEALRHRAEKP